MGTETVVREIMTPLASFPCLAETSTIGDAVRMLRSYCPLDRSEPCGYNELLVVDGGGRLLGRVSQQGMLHGLFSSLLPTNDVKAFSGKLQGFSDLTTLLDAVLLEKGQHHLQDSIVPVIEKGLRPLPATATLLHAMAVMVLSKETVLPVEDNGTVCGVVKLSQIFAAIGDALLARQVQ